MNKDLLMTYEQYKAARPGYVPYTYIIEKDGQYIYYFGSRHSFDPNDPQFGELDKFFNDFLSKTNGKDRIVLIEGGNWQIMENKERAIIECSEAGYGAYLAAQADIQRTSPEPKDVMRFAELSKNFSREEIVFFEFALAMYQWHRLTEKKDIREYVQPFLDMIQVKTKWDDVDFSFEHMQELQKNWYGVEFDPNNTQFYYNLVDPTQNNGVTNRISKFEDTGFRDRYILGEIEKYWNEGKSIFIIYGATHAVMQEPAIRSLI